MSGKEKESVKLKSGFVAVVGRPSAGKSTFINTLIGYKVSIVSSIPQTTRHNIRGIYNSELGQIIFIDTPGMHYSEKKINSYMLKSARSALDDSELILYLIDLSRPYGDEEAKILKLLKIREDKTIIALNKVDLVTKEIAELRKAKLLEKINPLKIVRTSAIDQQGCIKLAKQIFSYLPEGDILYPDRECYTDQTQEFRISEIIREKIFLNFKEEIPHSVYVDVDEITFNKAKNAITINALIVVETESQKRIVIGKNGRMIKQVGILAREDIKETFGKKSNLFLKVKVHKKWRKDTDFLDSFGIY